MTTFHKLTTDDRATILLAAFNSPVVGRPSDLIENAFLTVMADTGCDAEAAAAYLSQNPEYGCGHRVGGCLVFEHSDHFEVQWTTDDRALLMSIAGLFDAHLDDGHMPAWYETGWMLVKDENGAWVERCLVD